MRSATAESFLRCAVWAASRVAGDWLGSGVVIRRVAVEGGDDVVAVAVRLVEGEVLVLAVGVGVAGDVEPVPAPALAEAGAGQQAVDHPGERVGGGVGDK